MVSIKTVTYTSVWDDSVRVSTQAKLNLETGEVFAIQQCEVAGVDSCTGEYIEADGKEYPVSEKYGKYYAPITLR